MPFVRTFVNRNRPSEVGGRANLGANHERGERFTAAQRNRGRGWNPGYGPRTWRPLPKRVETANANFGLLVMTMFRLCQLQHQLKNWIDLIPRGVERNVDAFFSFLHLPRPDEALFNRLFGISE